MRSNKIGSDMLDSIRISGRNQTLIAVVVMTAATLFAMYLAKPTGPIRKPYYDWVDVCRIKAVFDLAQKIESHKDATGFYPFQDNPMFTEHPYGPLGANVEIYVNPRRETDQVSKYNIIGFGYLPALYDEMAKTQRSFRIFYDPLKEAKFSPSIIRYAVNIHGYTLSTYLFNKVTPAKTVDEYAHEMTITSRADLPDSIAWADVVQYRTERELANQILSNDEIKAMNPCPFYGPEDHKKALARTKSIRPVQATFILQGNRAVKVTPKFERGVGIKYTEEPGELPR